jgi:ribonuclease HII
MIIGVDEAGRGPAIGPLVVSAVMIPNSDIRILEEIGVKDSKKYNKIKRMKIFKLIMKNCYARKWNISKVICSASEIDKTLEKSNLNKLEVKLFAEAIEKIGFSKKITHINVDACDVNEVRFGNNIRTTLSDKWNHVKIISKHKMDETNLITAAASIVAKVTRDSAIEELNNCTDFEIGSGYPSDLITKKAIKKMILDEYPHKELRWSWKTVKKEWMRARNKPFPNRVEFEKNIVQKTLGEWTK